jgi:transketolase
MLSDHASHLRCINTLRLLAVDTIERAKSGHPGLPLGAAPMAYLLWTQHMRHAPGDVHWANRDRFVLSAGHGSALLYALMHLCGYPLSLADLQQFRQLRSRTPGHPETFVTPGVEATTGPLGQGLANAVGMAIAERSLAHQYNRPGYDIVDHRTFALVSDGDLMEGIAAEAASLAGHLRLGKLTVLYDANAVTLDGPADLAFSEDVAARWRACGWQVITVADGNTDLDAIDAALSTATGQQAVPTLVVVRTTIGFGAPTKQGTSASHGSPLGDAEVRRLKAALGCDPDATFAVPSEAAAVYAQVAQRGARAQAAWAETFAAWQRAYPQLAADWQAAHAGVLCDGWDEAMPDFPVGSACATRQAGSRVLNAIAPQVPWLIGGDADLSVSTLTAVQGGEDFCGQTGAGRNLRFGVREHAMGGILNGMAYHGGLRPYGATFFVFSDYLRPALRLAALSGLPVLYLWTHDSVGVGEDGPTHQPIEHLMALRAMPNVVVLRPADGPETAQAWRVALGPQTGPVGLVLTRQSVPTLDRRALKTPTWAQSAGVARGAYILRDTFGPPDGIFLATGSEVHLAVQAAETLADAGLDVRVVSMPSWELFARQDAAYQAQVLPAAIRARVSIEAGVSWGWSRWVGEAGESLGIDRFGLSAPGPQALAELGLTVEHAAQAMRRCIARLRDQLPCGAAPYIEAETYADSAPRRQSR